jgi:hypothetical protein
MKDIASGKQNLIRSRSWHCRRDSRQRNVSFQDTETSTGNQFVAGKLSYKSTTPATNGKECKIGGVYLGRARRTCACTWSAKDLSGELFANFLDVKPGMRRRYSQHPRGQ